MSQARLSACMLISHRGHTDTIQVYSVTVMTHVKALQAGHSSQGTSEPITPAIVHSLILVHHKILSNPCPFRQNSILVTGTNCNGYGIWINKTKLRYDLIMFNRLPEPWRASPESWHLSRVIITQLSNIHN